MINLGSTSSTFEYLNDFQKIKISKGRDNNMIWFDLKQLKISYNIPQVPLDNFLTSIK